MTNPKVLQTYFEAILRAETLEVAQREARIALKLIEKHIPKPRKGRKGSSR